MDRRYLRPLSALAVAALALGVSGCGPSTEVTVSRGETDRLTAEWEGRERVAGSVDYTASGQEFEPAIRTELGPDQGRLIVEGWSDRYGFEDPEVTRFTLQTWSVAGVDAEPEYEESCRAQVLAGDVVECDGWVVRVLELVDSDVRFELLALPQGWELDAAVA